MQVCSNSAALQKCQKLLHVIRSASLSHCILAVVLSRNDTLTHRSLSVNRLVQTLSVAQPANCNRVLETSTVTLSPLALALPPTNTQGWPTLSCISAPMLFQLQHKH